VAVAARSDGATGVYRLHHGHIRRSLDIVHKTGFDGDNVLHQQRCDKYLHMASREDDSMILPVF
jgi:hypothetical protein